MFSERAFSLIETLVAMVIGVALVVTIGTLGGNLIRHRAVSDANSAATSLAQRQIERLKALPNPSTHADLGAGTHGPFAVDETASASIGGPYEVAWEVFDDQPAALPDVDSKRIIVTVTHTNDAMVRTRLETYYQTSQVAAAPTPAGPSPTATPPALPTPTPPGNGKGTGKGK